MGTGEGGREGGREGGGEGRTGLSVVTEESGMAKLDFGC
jgi:hypothetical protein